MKSESDSSNFYIQRNVLDYGWFVFLIAMEVQNNPGWLNGNYQVLEYGSRDYKSSTGIVVGMTTKFPPLASTVDSAVASLRLLAELIIACPPPSMGRIDCIFRLVFYS
ncbi:hypothetical protein C0J52_24780 [Blattella germanica]|nr:hypothetical protein C0J52_24780 [Blattella germanica]